MTFTVLFVLFVFLFYRAVISLPISQDISSVQSPVSVDVQSTNKIIMFDTETILSRSADNEGLKILAVGPTDRTLPRTKRQVIDGQHNCAEGMVWFWNMCVTLEKYKRLTEDYDEEI